MCLTPSDHLLITVLAGLPRALFTFAYERQTRIVRAAVSDRIMRLTAVLRTSCSARTQSAYLP
jgi:hypothetical protein